MSKYERFNHAKTFLRYHLIFSTKYRRKILNPIRPTTGSLNTRDIVTSPKNNWITLQGTRETTSSLKPNLFRRRNNGA